MKKTIFSFLLVFTALCIILTIESFGQYSNVFLKVRPIDSKYLDSNAYKIKLYVINGRPDTLVMIREITMNNLKSNMIVYPLEGAYSPNFLFFESSDLTFYNADGRFSVHYDSIPPLLTILPYGQVTLTLDVSSLKELIKRSVWNIYSFVMLAKKHDLDSVMITRLSSKMTEYNTSYSNDSTLILKNINLNNEKHKKKSDRNEFDIDFIQDVFLIRIGS